MHIQTLRAPNPGAFTGTGTNTYVLGARSAVVIDPGPDLAPHLAAILDAVGTRDVEAILVTHAHLDHSALAPRLAALTSAPILAFGDAASGITPRMRALATEGLEGGEGVDSAFSPTRNLADGEVIELAGLSIETIHTPGHMAGHVSLAVDDLLFSGDHVMGWSTSIVSPPEGDMAAYMASLRRLTGRRWSRFLPGHGAAVETPADRLSELIAHRLQREAAILQALRPAPLSAAELAERVYTTTPPALLPAATRNVLAHLIALMDQGQVAAEPGPLAQASFFRI